MVGAASALRVFGAGLHSFGFTVFFLPLSQDLNINRTLVALPATWQEAWGHEFAAFRTLCLQSTASFATAVRCPDCGCLHSVIHRHDHTGAIGIRRCDPPDCQVIC